MGEDAEVLSEGKILGGGVLIFVTCGTHTMQFNRLLEMIDSLIEEGKIRGKVIAQTGNSTYIPKNCEHFRFAEQKRMEELHDKSDIIISHAGAGSVITALSHRKKLIVVPRLKKYGEHVDDHQLDLAAELERGGKLLAAKSKEELAVAISKMKSFKPKLGSSKALMENLGKYIANL